MLWLFFINPASAIVRQKSGQRARLNSYKKTAGEHHSPAVILNVQLQLTQLIIVVSEFVRRVVGDELFNRVFRAGRLVNLTRLDIPDFFSVLADGAV